MAINFLNTVDLNQNQLVNAAIQSVATDPTTNGVLGQLIFNTTSNTLKVCTTAYVIGPPVVNSVYTEVGGGVETLTLNDSTYIDVNSTGTAADPVFAPALSAVDGTAVVGTRFLSKDNTWDIPTVDNYTSWTADSDEGTDITVTSGFNLKFTGAVTAGGAGIATDSAISANEMTIALVNAGGTPSATTFYRGDGQWITPTNDLYTLTKAGGSGNLILNNNGTAQNTISFSGTTSEVTLDVATANSYTIGLPDDVILTTSLVVNSGGAATRSSFGYQVTIPETPLVNSDAASKKYVDDLVAGGLTFLGTFRADTGEILSGTNSGLYLYQVPGGAGTRVAVVVGDYYVVATAGGDFYANTSYPLDIGDSIIGVSAAAADASVVTDWSLVSQGVTVNSFTNANGTYISSSVPANTNATGAVTIGTLDLSAIDGTSDVNTKFLSKDNTWDVPSYTTNTDAKYALTAEPKSGTSVPLTLTGSDGGSTTIVDLTEGANITLTRTSATEITIASTDTGALGKNILLNTSDAWVSSSAAGGITTFAVDVSNANVFNGTVGAVNVKCEVIDARTTPAGVAGQTVYADITRGVNAGGATFGLQSLNISFTGTPASSAYRVLLTYIG